MTEPGGDAEQGIGTPILTPEQNEPDVGSNTLIQTFSNNSKPEPITYTWSHINVWVGSEPQGSGSFPVNKPSASRFGSRSQLPCWRKKGVEPKQILNNATGVVRPGELLAIQGASGAGKTTLLNVLTFRNSRKLKVTGDRKINGVVITPDMLTSVSAYVQQEDLFVPTLTVREHLIFQARVRMHKHLTNNYRMTRVEEVIQELGLSKCADTKIGMPGRVKGISGGEMKRLSFASEVLTDCQLVFCDEPTSGLDSFMAKNVMGHMRRMARKGKTIICTIHQPSSEVYALFDRLLLMAEGRVAYLGDSQAVVDFFASNGLPCPANYNPSDFLIQSLAIQPGYEEECRRKVSQICDSFDESETAEDIKNTVEKIPSENAEFFERQAKMHRRSPYKARWIPQFRAVLWRSWLSVIREPVFKTNLLQTTAIAIFLGLVYLGQKNDQSGVRNLNGALFLFITAMTFQHVLAVVHVFCEELPVFLREHWNGMYRTDVYFLCKMIAELPLYIISPTIFVTISYNMIQAEPEFARFLRAWAILVTVANVGCSFGYMVSCAAGKVSLALIIAPILMMPFMLFGGFFLKNKSVPKYLVWIQWLSWFMYGNEALSVNQWDGVTNITCKDGSPICFHNGSDVLKELEFNKDDLGHDVTGLIFLLIGFRVVAFLGLLFRTYRKN